MTEQKKKTSRRNFLKMAMAFASSGAVAWTSNPMSEAEEVVIGVDVAVPSADETVIFTFPGLDKMISTGHSDAPFAPYSLDPSAIGKWVDFEGD